MYLTNADTELLTLRSVADDLSDVGIELRGLSVSAGNWKEAANSASLICVRLLGGKDAFLEGLEYLAALTNARRIPLVCFSGESIPDPELALFSNVASGIVTQGFEYLVRGGTANYANFVRFVSDTCLLGGYGFQTPQEVPDVGIFKPIEQDGSAPRVAVIFYRAHLISGNTVFVESLAREMAAQGISVYPVFCYSLRSGYGERSPVYKTVKEIAPDVIVTTVLAGGSMDSQGQTWDVSEMKEFGVPIVQAIVSSSDRESWQKRSSGLVPLDVTMQVAIPEFDGRVITVPFSFKEVVDSDSGFGSDISAYRADPERTSRVTQVVARLARLRHKANYDKKVAIVISAYPTKRSRLGNAVGLDTPASVIALLHRLQNSGYRIDRIPESGDALMEELMDTFNYDVPTLSVSQVQKAQLTLSAPEYAAEFEKFGEEIKGGLKRAWGEPPGSVYLDGSNFVFPGISLGNVFITIQPPRGFGENPIAIYHSPDLAPTHHYMAFYRMLDIKYDADAIIHVGKHGTLEWLPGKSLGLSENCYPDQALGAIPLIYPFVVNDPGEGTQAKRRAHAVIIDHMVPPLTRADTYDELSKLESLLDTHARYAGMDPSKLPGLREAIWEVLVDAQIARELRLGERPDFEDAEFDVLVSEIDGYLCEIKDAQIRGGLHILGEILDGQAELDMIAALTRIGSGADPSLRQLVAAELGIDLKAGHTRQIDQVEEEVQRVVGIAQASGFDLQCLKKLPKPYRKAIEEVCVNLVPRLRATPRELEAVLEALDGKYIASGPSGAPSRGMAHVLPTGRNFYSIDPKALPSTQSWVVGQKLAEAMVERYFSEEGSYPSSVGIVVWGTAAMRTAGDDISQTLALIGVMPVWDMQTGRVTGCELISRGELGRPRVDVTLRISGFFRDAFPHVVTFLSQAFELASHSPEADNPLAKDASSPRIFGPKPGSYGSGILPLIEARNWRSNEDLAKVYLTWSGYSYTSKSFGRYDPESMMARFKGIQVASKNQDNREHDIFDSDDYMQDHGGMIAAVRHLSGSEPKSYFGDSADPGRPKVKSLAQEAAKVVRSRVINPKWIEAMKHHGYKGAFEMAATVDYLFGYDATANIVEDWMYEKVTQAYVADASVRKFFEQSNPGALTSIAERLLEASQRGLWNASEESLDAIRSAMLEAEGWEEIR
ncbi:MAG: cobaltochelatase subunit CobN [Actinomycetota bacterium]|nr:MAG: cobaltochelatase subunit CobN [Actinomycetota bacterium]